MTVGTQLSFDRLVVAVDEWAGRNQHGEVFAQIGPTTYRPRNMGHAEFVKPARADELMRRADLIVSHAGMGSILTALHYQTPILIMPRRAALGEHRNDHQLATARWLDTRAGIFVAWDESELALRLNNRVDLVAGSAIEPYAKGPLVERLAEFIRSS